MALKKPPLVEAWMSFRYEPPVGGGSWTEEKYHQFSTKIADTHPIAEKLVQSGLRAVKGRGGQRVEEVQLVETVVAARSFSEDGTRAVQLRPNEMVVNYVRTESAPYPGFEALLAEAIGHHRAYTECYRPAGVIEVALHYVDVVEVPVPPTGEMNSEGYFTINLQLPSSAFASVSVFQLAALVRVAGTGEPVEVVFSSELYARGDPARRFRLEWHRGVKSPGRMSDDEIEASLRSAHDLLFGCFRSVFTTQGWNLFEPDSP